MKYPALLLLAPLLLGATAPVSEPSAPPSEAPTLEALETPVPPDDPPDADEATTGPSFSSLVSWAGDVEAFTPPLAALADDPPTDERSPRPTAEEWKHADEVALSREHALCKARRVREWLRIACKPWGSLAAIDLLAGPSEGVAFDARESGEQAVIFPVRRGDRRVLQIVHVASSSRYSVDYDTAFAISEDWLADAKGPTVVVD
jgi:hypothetical protein